MPEPLGAAELVVEGYVMCGCGAWLAKGSPEANRKLCDECLEARTSAIDVTYVVEGETFTTKAAARAKKARKRKKRAYRAPTESHRAWNRARGRAMTRLIEAHRDTYELILAEEKAREGIVPRERALDDFAPGPGYDPGTQPPPEA